MEGKIFFTMVFEYFKWVFQMFWLEIHSYDSYTLGKEISTWYLWTVTQGSYSTDFAISVHFKASQLPLDQLISFQLLSFVSYLLLRYVNPQWTPSSPQCEMNRHRITAMSKKVANRFSAGLSKLGTSEGDRILSSADCLAHDVEDEGLESGNTTVGGSL